MEEIGPVTFNKKSLDINFMQLSIPIRDYAYSRTKLFDCRSIAVAIVQSDPNNLDYVVDFINITSGEEGKEGVSYLVVISKKESVIRTSVTLNRIKAKDTFVYKSSVIVDDGLQTHFTYTFIVKDNVVTLETTNGVENASLCLVCCCMTICCCLCICTPCMYLFSNNKTKEEALKIGNVFSKVLNSQS